MLREEVGGERVLVNVFLSAGRRGSGAEGGWGGGREREGRVDGGNPSIAFLTTLLSHCILITPPQTAPPPP